MSTVLLEKPHVPQLAKKFPTFHVTRRFITVPIAAHMSYPQQDESIPFLLRCIVILNSRLFLVFQVVSFLQSFPHQQSVPVSLLPINATVIAQIILLDLLTQIISGV